MVRLIHIYSFLTGQPYFNYDNSWKPRDYTSLLPIFSATRIHALWWCVLAPGWGSSYSCS